MYNATINVEDQEFVIEDRRGNFIVSRPMPYSEVPNPGREVLMGKYQNLEVWELICDLVDAANRGRSK